MSQKIWFAYFSTQALQHSQSNRFSFFIASQCCVSSSHLAEGETAKPASAWLCAGRISLFPPCVTLLHKGMQWGQSIRRDAFLSLSRVVVCGWLIKHWGLPVGCYWALFGCNPPPPPHPPSLCLPPSLYSHSLCDITVWLGRMEKLLALEIDACSWLRSHSHGRHTSHADAFAHPHVSTRLLRDAGMQFRRRGRNMWAAVTQVSLMPSFPRRPAHIAAGQDPLLRLERVWVCVWGNHQLCIQWAHSWPRLHLPDSINHPHQRQHSRGRVRMCLREKKTKKMLK